MEETLPSLMKDIFLGEFRSDLLTPYPKMKKEELETVRAMVDAVDKFLSNINSREVDEKHKLPPEVLQEMKNLGLFGLIIPEEFGGLGLSNSAYARMIQQMANHDGSVSLTAGAHSSIGFKALVLFGTPEQKKKYFPKLATGESIASFALTEPGAGSDAASIRTRAELSADGKTWILNGEKIWITNGGMAQFFTVFAKTEQHGTGKGRITAFIVDRNSEGFSVGAEEKKMGITGSSTVTLHFDNVKVPNENVLGEVGKGFKVAMEVLNHGRSGGLGGGCIGAMKVSLKRAIQHAKERKQFGRSIAEFGLVKDKLGRMAAQIYAVESVVNLTTGLQDRGDTEYSIEAAIGKIFASDSCWWAVNEALQIAGGTGYMREYPFERTVRDCRINMIFEGTNEILRLFIALSGLKEVGEYLKDVVQGFSDVTKDPIKAFGVLSDYAGKKVRQNIGNFKISCFDSIFGEEVASLEHNIPEFSQVCEKIIRRHKKEIAEKQFACSRIANIAIDIYVTMAVLSRCTASIKEKGKGKCDKEIEMTKVICNEARRRIRSNFVRMDKNDDEIIKGLSDYVVSQGQYVWDVI